MKKIFLSFIAGALLSSVTYAQEATETSAESEQEKEKKVKVPKTSSGSDFSFISKNDHEVLPQKGDYGLGFAANNLLSYAGNLANSGNNGGATNFGATKATLLPAITNTIFGKYMVDGSTAHRVTVGFDFNTTSTSFLVDSDISADPDEMVSDKSTITTSNLLVGFGIEKRRGSSRIQGIYGAEAIIGKSFGTSYSYSYGNVMGAANQNPTDVGFGDPTGLNNPTPFNNGRIVSANVAGSVLIGARAFVGVEYFVAPKLSLGAELYWGAAYTKTGKSKVTYEAWDATGSDAAAYESVSAKGTGAFNIGMNNAGGTVNMFFYF